MPEPAQKPAQQAEPAKPQKKVWKTPHVIVSTLSKTENAAGPGSDGGGNATS